MSKLRTSSGSSVFKLSSVKFCSNIGRSRLGPKLTPVGMPCICAAAQRRPIVSNSERTSDSEDCSPSWFRSSRTAAATSRGRGTQNPSRETFFGGMISWFSSASFFIFFLQEANAVGDTSAAEDKDEDRGTPMDDPAAIWLSTSALVHSNRPRFGSVKLAKISSNHSRLGPPSSHPASPRKVMRGDEEVRR